MISRYFIDRPVFGTVISVVVVLLGLVSYSRLPLAQYPEVAPPVVQVTATMLGASAKTVAETVAAPIEQEINGVLCGLRRYKVARHGMLAEFRERNQLIHERYPCACPGPPLQA